MTDVATLTQMTEDDLCAEAHPSVKDNWNPVLSLRAWRERLVESGWAFPSWPVRWYGKGLPTWADDVVRTEIQKCGAVS